MKWFKHMTASWDDEKLARLVGEGGESGLAMYGLYWRLLEIVAAQMEGKTPSCSVQYPVARWSLLLSLRGSVVFSKLSRLAATGVVTVERQDTDIVVRIPNLLKYRDEYARKSGHTPDNIPPRTEAEGEGEVDTEAEKNKPIASRAKKPARSADAGKLIGTLPLNDGKDFEIRQSYFDELVPLYPAIDVKDELRKFKAWCVGNPERRKTRVGIRKAINRWLSKAQDEAHPNQHRGNNHGKPTVQQQAVAVGQAILDELYPETDERGVVDAHHLRGVLEAGSPSPRPDLEDHAPRVLPGTVQ